MQQLRLLIPSPSPERLPRVMARSGSRPPPGQPIHVIWAPCRCWSAGSVLGRDGWRGMPRAALCKECQERCLLRSRSGSRGCSRPSSAGGCCSLFATQVPAFWNNDELTALLQAHAVQINAQSTVQTTPLLQSLLLGFGPALLIGLIIILLMRRAAKSGGGMGALGNFGGSKARRVDPATIRVTFDDVAGIDEAKSELTEIVDFLRNPMRYGRLGGRMPHGVLLSGAPGTGKTLLARAVAGEAHAAFSSLSASEANRSRLSSCSLRPTGERSSTRRCCDQGALTVALPCSPPTGSATPDPRGSHPLDPAGRRRRRTGGRTAFYRVSGGTLREVRLMHRVTWLHPTRAALAATGSRRQRGPRAGGRPRLGARACRADRWRLQRPDRGQARLRRAMPTDCGR